MIRQRTFWGYAAILVGFLAGSLGAYVTILDTYFVSDDFVLRRAVTQDGAWGLWSSSGSDFFRPLISLSFYADNWLWDDRASGYHLINVLLHGLTSFGVFVLAAQVLGDFPLSARRRAGAALLAGGIFLLLPSHSGAVSWIAGRTDVIATTCAVYALVAYRIYVDHGSRWVRVAALILFGLALLAKEAVIGFPLIILLLDLLHPAARPVRARWWGGVFFGAIWLGYVALRYAVIGQWVGGYGGGVPSPPDLARNGTIFAFRSAAPPIWIETESLTGYVLMTVFGLGLIGLIIVGTRPLQRKWRAFYGAQPAAARMLIGLIGAWGLALAPVTVFTSATQTTLRTITDERLVYFPSVFAALLIAILMALVIRDRRALIGGSVALLVFYGGMLAYSNRQWQRAAGLAEDVVQSFAAYAPGDEVIVLVVPDNLNGAYVLRNGLAAALDLAYGDDFGIDHPATGVLLDDPRAMIRVEVAALDRYVVRGADPATQLVFYHAADPVTLADFACGVTYTPCAPMRGEPFSRVTAVIGGQPRVVLYWSAGEMREAGESQDRGSPGH